MSPNDPSSDLDSRIAAIVEKTVGRMRDELTRRMQDNESRLEEMSHLLQPETPAPETPAPETPAHWAEAPTPEPTPAAGDPVADLFTAVVAIDRGSSQQDVLAALLEGVGQFAGRSALFLTRADGAQGWGSYGFEETAGEIQDVLLSYEEGPLAVLAEGRGCVTLTADECAELGNRMGVSAGAEGLLVPFILRDRLAAALYVDRFADGPPLERQSLQLLAYVGAQAVEGLALRQRGETPTLRIATEAAAAPGVPLWAGPAAAPEAAEPATAEPPVPDTQIPAPDAPMPEPAADETPADLPLQVEPQLSEPQPAPPPDAIDAATVEMTLAELAGAEKPGPVTEASPTMEPEPVTEVDSQWSPPAISLDESEVSLEEAVEEPGPSLEALSEPPLTAPTDEPQPWAETVGPELSTPEAEPTAEIETPPAAAMQPPPLDAPASGAGETTEVRPPTDVSGPGWAFTAGRAAAETGDDAQHEEARRLARLLVTEIKLYNEEQVEEGRRGNDIYARLREDIDRSRQIFNERVDDSVRGETDYFHDEMVRILAGGNAEALGL